MPSDSCVKMCDQESSKPQILLELKDGLGSRLAVVTIARPESLNTLSVSTIRKLTATLKHLPAETDIVLLKGLGDAFAAGADINELLRLTPVQAVDFSLLGKGLFDTIRRAPQIFIAAIDGFCMGGGLDLALSCDIRYASNSAIFAHPGSRIGIVTGFGGTQRLPSAAGLHRALEAFATARRWDAAEALSMGIIQELADRTAFHLALQRIASMLELSSVTLRRMKQILRLLAFRNREVLLTNYLELISRCSASSLSTAL